MTRTTEGTRELSAGLAALRSDIGSGKAQQVVSRYEYGDGSIFIAYPERR